MGIPVNALKDDELLHYAGLDPGVAAELARRISEDGLDPGAERKELLETIRELETEVEYASDSESQLHYLQGDAHMACKFIRRAMSPEEKEFSVSELLQKALDYLE